jgi:hypothetical protein
MNEQQKHLMEYMIAVVVNQHVLHHEEKRAERKLETINMILQRAPNIRGTIVNFWG